MGIAYEMAVNLINEHVKTVFQLIDWFKGCPIPNDSD